MYALLSGLGLIAAALVAGEVVTDRQDPWAGQAQVMRAFPTPKGWKLVSADQLGSRCPRFIFMAPCDTPRTRRIFAFGDTKIACPRFRAAFNDWPGLSSRVIAADRDINEPKTVVKECELNSGEANAGHLRVSAWIETAERRAVVFVLSRQA